MEKYGIQVERDGRLHDVNLKSKVRQIFTINRTFPLSATQISIDFPLSISSQSKIALVPFSFRGLEADPYFMRGAMMTLYYRTSGSQLIISKEKISNQYIIVNIGNGVYARLPYTVVEYV